jgi:anti-anti-sigma factor
MGDALTIGVRSERDRAIATVAGEIDISTVTRLRERLFELAASSRHLVIDLDQVTFIDSAGLSALVGTANQAAAHGTSVHVVCARPKILKVFRLTGLDRRLPPAPTVEEALAASGPQPRYQAADPDRRPRSWGARTARPRGPGGGGSTSWPATGSRPPEWAMPWESRASGHTG